MTLTISCSATPPTSLARLQYPLLRAGADTAVEISHGRLRGLELAAGRQPDVVVSELAIEGLGGAEFVRRLRASSPGSQVVAWTEERDPEQVARALEAGAAGYLLKGDDPTELVARRTSCPRGAVIVSAAVAATPRR